MKKRIIAAIMTVLMIAMSMPQFVMAETGEQIATSPITVVGNIAIDYVSTWTPVQYRLNFASQNTEPSDTPSTLSVGSAHLLYKLDISNLDASKIVRDVTFTFTKQAAGATRTDLYVVPNGDNNWTKASDFTGSSKSSNSAEFEQRQASLEKYYNEISDAITLAGQPFATYTFAASTANTSFTTDITSIVNTARQNDEDYITICIKGSSTQKLYAINGTYPPVVSAVEEAPSLFNVISSSPESGTTNASATDDITVTFSNPVDDTTVSASNITIAHANGTVALADEDITVSGNAITISKELERYTDYTITIAGISDTYGQSLSTPYSFSFSTNLAPDASASLIPVAGDIAIDYVSSWTPAQYRINQTSPANTKPNDDKTNHSSGSTRYILIKLDISDVDGTKTLRDVAFSYTKTSAGMLQNASVYVVPNGNIEWTKASDFCLGVDTAYDYTADSAAFNARQTAIETYYNQVTAAMTESNLLDKCDIDAAANTTRTVDITSAVLAAKANAENYITLCIVGSDTTTIAGGKHATYPLTVSAIQETPSFGVVSSSPANGGVMAGVNKPIELALATNITEATKGHIKLLKASDESAVAADVTIKNNKVTITPSLLDDNTAYKVVFEAGLADTFGNTVTANTVALTFTSGIPFGVEPLKFTLDQAPVYATATEAASYTAGDRVTAVSVVTNNSSDSRDAKIFIALYDNNTNTLLSVSAVEGTIPCDGTAVQFSASIDVPETAKGTCLKAFFWDVTNDSLAPLCVSKTIGQN